ncbi:MAG: hypothetical protein MUC62_01395 [Candidatus Thermoplasmatota archaeon]|nr:hypothetical protein [Candidatus Thermoplasmatota archaeon]
MTTDECISRVLSSPDMKCPLCGKHLEVWIYGEVPLYRCSICGGLGFKVDPAMSEEVLSKGGKTSEADSLCPGCGKELMRSSMGKLRLDSCSICDWVFVENVEEPPLDDEEEDDNCSQYALALREIGRKYIMVISKLGN